MINLFRETYSSLQDNYYGRVIIEKTLKEVVWYWTKYLLLIGAAMVLFAVFFMTNRLPQLPKIIQFVIPEGTYDLSNGVFSSSINQPFVSGDSDFSFIIDTEATPSSLSPYLSGILITKSDIVLKSADGSITTQSIKNFPSFSTSPAAIAGLISDNFIKVWGMFFVGIILLMVFIGSIFWLQKILSFMIWSSVILLISKYMLKKRISYVNTLKIVIYASVLPLMLSVILSSSPNPVQDILGLGIMAYFTFNWIRHLGHGIQPPILPQSLPKKSTQKQSRKHRA